jgi:energy-coupling factor transporter ATP-binding protein EcfA2
MWNSSGSEWHRWDPHLHAPGTLLCDQFNGDWETYLTSIETASPLVEALGVTDYFSIQTYRRAKEHRAAGRMPGVKLIFPNVEMRLDIKTTKSKGVNLHLLFSPEDPNHEQEIERLLSLLEFEFDERPYRGSISDLTNLGYAVEPSLTTDSAALYAGTNQFKTTLADLKKLFRKDKWFRNNCLIAVAGGSNDGTSGLQEDSSFKATRLEIEAFANIIFASTPKQREFWLGKGALDGDAIEKTYGALKPCLHGSDAHRQETVAVPDLQRYCWLYGDLAFETLRQAVIEPDRRVWIGSAPPPEAIATEIIRTLTTHDAPWLATPSQQFNSGLVTIIGARGSGKTALMDLLAAAAGAFSPIPSDSSFLHRAASPEDLIGDASVDLIWGAGETSKTSLRAALDGFWGEREQVRYLSQQFVERLCSSSGLAIELRQEMERVVFESTEQQNRFEANSFETLADTLLEPVREKRRELKDSIREIGIKVVEEEVLRDKLPEQLKEITATNAQIVLLRKELVNILPKESVVHAQALAALETLCGQAETKIEALRRRRKLLEDLGADTRQTRSSREPARFEELQRRFAGAGLTPLEWESFRMAFVGKVDTVVALAIQTVDQAILFAIEGNPSKPISPSATPTTDWPLNALKVARDAKKQLVGIDAARQKKYDELQRELVRLEGVVRKLEADTNTGKGAAERRKTLVERRRQEYREVIKSIVEEEDILNDLYLPLRKTLNAAAGTLAKLAFVVERQVDLDAWVKAGEELLDLRRSSVFQGKGSLEQKAREYLLRAWTSGTPEDVDSAMDKFRADLHEQLIKAQPDSMNAQERREWPQQIATWLYDISHIEVQYSIVYDGTPIERLSPGTRGIVLLLLYLAVDIHDRRPLFIDQPEENLDPQSVFDELVPHFRAARQRRQVIVVTHNANLVVNTDADQVVIASSQRRVEGGLPIISYESGSLENPKIRAAVCRLLEGGQRAFLERERRYRFHWGEPELSEDLRDDQSTGAPG